MSLIIPAELVSQLRSTASVDALARRLAEFISTLPPPPSAPEWGAYEELRAEVDVARELYVEAARKAGAELERIYLQHGPGPHAFGEDRVSIIRNKAGTFFVRKHANP